jgi:hypothetical protein
MDHHHECGWRGWEHEWWDISLIHEKINEFYIFIDFYWTWSFVITRCDVVGTWSREYQYSSSSSSSSSNSSSFYSSLFLVFTRCNKKFRVFDFFLTTFWQIFYKLFDNCLSTLCQLFVNFLTILTTFFFFCVAVACWAYKYYGTNFTSALPTPTSLLIAPGLRTIQFLS